MSANTIRRKLTKSTTRILGFSFAIVLVLVAVLNIINSEVNSRRISEMISQSLEAKGKILVQNNSFALSGMVADNAFLSVQELVRRTVADDPDVVYGIFMDANRQSWIYANELSSAQNTNEPVILNDSISKVVAEHSEPMQIIIPAEPFHLIEFCGPVFVEGEVAGYIRYGMSTEAVHRAEVAKRKSDILQMIAMLLVIGALGIVVFLLSYLAIRKEAHRLAQPIILLDSEAKIIANGEYSKPVHVDSDDEIGELAQSFEEMRSQIKRYTDQLEEIIHEKMQQVRDILDHIDQGLFTVNLDGSINEEYSRATATMFGATNLQEMKIQNLVGMSPENCKLWDDWIQIVVKRFGSMRWEKLTRLAPIQEFSMQHEDQKEVTLHFEFQRIIGKSGELARIMVLVQDVTEARRIERIVREEQARHENEVRTILGIVNTVPELIQEFFRDIDARLRSIEGHLNLVGAQHRNDSRGVIDHTALNSMFRDLHTIKGNASSYGFEELSRVAHEAEDCLEGLRKDLGLDRENTLLQLGALIQELWQERKSIDDTARMLHGGSDGTMVSVSERKIFHIQKLARTLMRAVARDEHNPYTPLLQACEQIRQVPFGKLSEKYASMVERLALKLGKQIRFQAIPPEEEIEPKVVVSLNDCLVQLVRNAADHGIEFPETRRQCGKNPCGTISLVALPGEGMQVLEVRDDGAGIDPDVVARKAIEKGYVTEADVALLDGHKRMDLIFTPGLSIRDEVSEVSGRGVGLDVVRKEVERQGGRIFLESTVGKGASFRIELPKRDV